MKQCDNSTIKQCNKGNVIILGILVMAGIVISGLTVSTFINRELSRAKEVDNSALAYFAAESGIEESLYQIRKSATPPSDIAKSFLLNNQAEYSTKAKNTETEIKIDFIVKGDFKTIDLYNLADFEEDPSLHISSVEFSSKGEVPFVSYQEWDHQEKELGPFKTLLSGGFLDPTKAYRLTVKAATDNIRDFNLKAWDQDDSQMEIPIPVTIDSLGQFGVSEQALKVTLASASPFGVIQPPPEEPPPGLPPTKLCGLDPGDPEPAIIDNVVLLTVGKAPLACDYITINEAVAAVPYDLVDDGNSYIIEVRDEETYPKIGRIGRKTDAAHTLTIRGADGKQPTITTTPYNDAIELYYTRFVTIENFRFTGNLVHRTGALELSGASDNIIRNNIFTNFDQSTILMIHGGHNNLIENNQFVANRYTAGVTIYWYNGGNIIRNNIFSNNSVGVAFGRMARANTIVDNTFFVDGSNQFAIRINGDIALDRAQLSTIDRNHYFVDADRNASFGLVQAGAGRATEERYHTQAEWCTATGFDCASDTNIDLTNPIFVRWREVKKTVCASGCDFTVIQDAFAAMPSHVPQGWRELINENISYTVEVQDSRTYTAPKQRIADISAITDPDRRILFTVKPGERPTLKASNYLPAVRIYYTSYVTVQGFHIDGPRSSNIWHGGLINEGGVHNSFIDNVIENVDGPGITFFSSGNAKGNVIRNAQWGVLLWNAKQAQSIVEHNILDRVRYGVFLRDRTNHVRIEHNTGYGNDRQIDVEACYQGTCDVVIQNNIFYSSGVYSAVYWFASQEYLSTSTIDYNTIYATDGKIGYVAGVGYLHTPDEWKATEKDEHGIFVDPLFANIATTPFDFHLQSTVGRFLDGGFVQDAVQSPAIDAGDPASDFVNEPDPNGGRVNQGAYGNTAEASKSQ